MADGKIIAISISERKGQKKHNIESANLIVDHGMEGDAHAGNWHRQISLLGIASIDHMRAQGADVNLVISLKILQLKVWYCMNWQ